ncbi:MAG: ABC transporter permease [Flavobacteriales bacterium TMED191]|nr:MAG: ABC transporter permease [Flavobacteriales bacterium TMED191]
MISFIFHKLLYALLVLLGVITIIFFLFNIMPADPAKMMLGDRDDQKQIDLINAKYYFDQPLYLQYFYYLNDLSPISVHLDSPEYKKQIKLFSSDNIYIILKYPYLRNSFYQKDKSISFLILNTLPNTLVLSFTSILIALFLAIPLGIISAYFKDSLLDRLISFFSILGMSMPSFLAAILMSYFFAFKLGYLTGLNITGSLYVLDDFGDDEILILKNLLLPAITLGIRPLAVIVNLTRNALIDELSSDYILLALSKGYSMLYVIVFHALRNSMSSVVTASSGWFAGMLSGAVFIEYIFGWNGLGKLLVDALINVDFPLVMGVILIIASCFIIINILVDLIYLWLDPRVVIN